MTATMREWLKSSAFVRRMHRLHELRLVCDCEKDLVQYLSHHPASRPAQRHREEHNRAAAEFNALRFFWMRRIEAI